MRGGTIAVLMALVVMGAMVMGSVPGCGSGGLGGGPPSPGMYFFYVDWCHVCQSMKPVVDQIEKEYEGEFVIERVNNESREGQEIASEHGVIGQPTMIIFDTKGNEVRRLMGYQDPVTLQREIDRILGRG